MTVNNKKGKDIGGLAGASTPENTLTDKVPGAIKKEEKKKETVIEIEKDKLNKLLESNDTLLQRIDRLESAASKAGLARYDSQNQGTLVRNVKLLTYDGHVVKSWTDMIKNKVEKNIQSKTWQEEQIIEITFFDVEESVTLHYETFNRSYEKIEAQIVKEEIMVGKNIKKYGDRRYTVKTKKGEKYVIGKKFVN